MIQLPPSKHLLCVAFPGCFECGEKSAPAGARTRGSLLVLVGSNLSRNREEARTVSRWPPFPCLDERRKRQSCTADAADTCSGREVVPGWLLAVFS